MPTWMTAQQISSQLIVGEQRLLEYGQRGNLAMYRMDDGSVLFDAEGAARYFRARNAAALRNPEGNNMGVLGKSRLADRRAEQRPLTSGREERRREVRQTVTNVPDQSRWARTG